MVPIISPNSFPKINDPFSHSRSLSCCRQSIVSSSLPEMHETATIVNHNGEARMVIINKLYCLLYYYYSNYTMYNTCMSMARLFFINFYMISQKVMVPISPNNFPNGLFSHSRSLLLKHKYSLPENAPDSYYSKP